MSLSRRRFLAVSGAALIAGCRGYDLGLTGGESFDEMLDLLHRTAVDFANGLSNHAPMAAEALVALGAPERAVPWVSEYATRLNEGQDSTILARVESLLADMDADGPQAVIEREVAELADGWVGAGWHGVLRTAHAARSLGREDTQSRRRELAFGLAYWRRDHARMPGEPGAAAESGFDVDDLFDAVPLLPQSEQQGGLIPDQLAPLVDLDGFVDVIARLDLDAEPVPDAIHRICTAASRAWASTDVSRSGAIVALHCITGTSALRLLLPWLSEPTARSCLGYAAQAAVAGTSAKGMRATPVSGDAPSPAEIMASGTTEDDEHTIKLAEAVLRELDHAPAPELRAAFAVWGA